MRTEFLLLAFAPLLAGLGCDLTGELPRPPVAAEPSPPVEDAFAIELTVVQLQLEPASPTKRPPDDVEILGRPTVLQLASIDYFDADASQHPPRHALSRECWYSDGVAAKAELDPDPSAGMGRVQVGPAGPFALVLDPDSKDRYASVQRWLPRWRGWWGHQLLQISAPGTAMPGFLVEFVVPDRAEARDLLLSPVARTTLPPRKPPYRQVHWAVPAHAEQMVVGVLRDDDGDGAPDMDLVAACEFDARLGSGILPTSLFERLEQGKPRPALYLFAYSQVTRWGMRMGGWEPSDDPHHHYSLMVRFGNGSVAPLRLD